MKVKITGVQFFDLIEVVSETMAFVYEPNRICNFIF